MGQVAAIPLRVATWQRDAKALGHATVMTLWERELDQIDRVDAVVRRVLGDVLGISAERTAAFTTESGLFGALPEFDSIAVMNVLTELEDRLGILIEDDEVDGDMLATFGALTAFVAAKLRH